mgnify:CR=1 FL=1
MQTPKLVRVVYWAGTSQVEAEVSTYKEAMKVASLNRNAFGPSFYEIATGEELFDLDGRGLANESGVFVL